MSTCSSTGLAAALGGGAQSIAYSLDGWISSQQVLCRLAGLGLWVGLDYAKAPEGGNWYIQVGNAWR